MSTWTDQEYKRRVGGLKNLPEEFDTVKLEKVTLDKVDWRTKGVVNPIKDQEECKSDWSFAAVSTIESAHAIKTRELLDLSDQQPLDCYEPQDGCNGGFLDGVFKYLKTNELEETVSYPYKGKQGDCTHDASKGKVGVSSYTRVTWATESVDNMKAAIALQPIVAAVQATNLVFQTYSSGILDSLDCGTQVDLGISIVGYGAEGETQYYIVRNQWGTKWGDKGYIKIAAVNGKGICGINQ